MFIYMKFKKISFVNCLVSAYIALCLNDNHGDQQKSTRSEKLMEGRLVITDFDEGTDQPHGPHARAFVNHLGYLARNRILINVCEWKKNKQRP
jgi:hypothetical protein